MTRTQVANGVAFQCCWMAFVASAAHENAWLGFIPLTLFAAWQLHASTQRRDDWLLVALAVAVGFLIDTMFAASGLLVYRAAVPSSWFAPVWILGLWAGFALTLNHSLRALQSRIGWSIAFGAVGGPAAYAAAGFGWHAVSFTSAPMALVALSIAWAIVTPLLTSSAALLTARHVVAEPERA